MGDIFADILIKYGAEDSIETAITKLLNELQNDGNLSESWRLLHTILCKTYDVKFDTNQVISVCLKYLRESENHLHLTVACKVLVQVLEKGNWTAQKDDLKVFLYQIQSSITGNIIDTHQHQNAFNLDHETCTMVLSQILPTASKVGLIEANQDESSITKLIQAMIESKNEKSIIRAAAFIQDPLLMDKNGRKLAFRSIETLFHPDEDATSGNHHGLTALCGVADVLFSDDALLAQEENWFLCSVKRLISHPVALNRKRAQYLLKRYVDVAVSEKADIFIDFFLILETLEERQIHIITPVLAKLGAWRDGAVLTGKALDPSWLSAVYSRILSHESNQVVKLGLHHVCRLRLECWPGFGSNQEEWLYGPLLRGLNNVTFYVRDSVEQLPALGQDIIQLLNKATGLVDERTGFFLRLLKAMSAVPWNCVGLFHLVYALASVPSGTPVLDEEALRVILDFLRTGLHTQHPLVRGSVQTLLFESVLNLVVPSLENLSWVVLILAALPRQHCYTHFRGSELYNKLKEWMRSHFTASQLNDQLVKLLTLHFQPGMQSKQPTAGSDHYSVDVVAVARFTVLLMDMEVADQEAIQKLLMSLESLENCHTRLYADQKILRIRLRLWSTLLEECEGDVRHSVMLTIGIPLSDSVVQYCLDRIESATEYSDLCDFLSILRSIVEKDGRNELVTTSAKRRLDTIARRCLEGATALERFKSVSVLLFAVEEETINDIIQRILELKMHCSPPQRLGSMADDGSQQVTWGAFMSHYFSQLWILLERKLPCWIHSVKAEELVEETITALDFAGVEASKSILRVLSFFLPGLASSNPSLCRVALDQCWSSCYEHRRSDNFWSLMDLFAKLAFQPELMEEQVTLRPLLFGRYLNDLKEQGENIAQLFNLAAEQVVDIWTNKDTLPSVDQHSIRFIIDILTFGLIHRKDEVVQHETFAFIRSLGNRCPTSQHIRSEDVADGQVRFQGLRFLLSLNPCEDANHAAIVSALIDTLLVEDRTLSVTKARHFASSHGHRLKHRIWTALLILQKLSSGRDKDIMDAALTGLVEDNPQPSVRFLHEWGVVRALVALPELEELLWSTMDRAVAQRTGSMVSFLTIVGHTSRCLGSNSDRLHAFVSQALPRIIPWAMAQHFTPRLYAIVVLDTVWIELEKQAGSTKNIQSMLEEYSTVRRLLACAPEMPNTRRNVEKLASDFYLSVFHPLDHFTLETLCYHLPRLAHLVAEEWIPVEWFDKLSSELNSKIRQRNMDDGRLASCQPAEWVAKAAGGTPPFITPLEEEDPSNPGGVGNVQKKITPWKQMLPDVDSLLAANAGRKSARAGASNDLIVIASLIDRIPNLGGLCRTCEVLGARAFVLSTLRITEDKDFVSLSVSAEKWINVIEVKSFLLIEYLNQLKLEGYSIVGAEQTASSQPLNRFRFPQKTALLLGHEKEGIPVELIQHLDHCVEVPQEGIIRSMNVHVTGAIFIWEYVRQQMGTLPALP